MKKWQPLETLSFKIKTAHNKDTMSNKSTLAAMASSVEPSTASHSVATMLNALATKQNQSIDAMKATPEIVEHLAKSGISVKNICSLFNKSFDYLSTNLELQDAFNRGRAHASSRLRSTLLDAALEDRNIQSAIYLDKIMSGDTVASEVNVNVATSQLATVSDEELMRVAFNVETVEDGENLGDTDLDKSA